MVSKWEDVTISHPAVITPTRLRWSLTAGAGGLPAPWRHAFSTGTMIKSGTLDYTAGQNRPHLVGNAIEWDVSSQNHADAHKNVTSLVDYANVRCRKELADLKAGREARQVRTQADAEEVARLQEKLDREVGGAATP